MDKRTWDEYKRLTQEEQLSRRKACRILGIAESTVRYREKKGLMPLDVEVHNSSEVSTKKLKIAVIADTQYKPGVSSDYLIATARYINSKNPDVVVHIGDHFDFPSLSSYDKGKKSFEGRRLKKDMDAGVEGLDILTEELTRNGRCPRMVFCEGNHENRLNRLMDDMPELEGFIKEPYQYFEEVGWETYKFLKPVNISGIYFCHYLANPFTGKPYGGNALNQLSKVGNSYVVGHKQVLDMAIRPTLDGNMQIGIVNGACYDFEEGYKGFQGNNHFRGIVMLNEVLNGFGLPSPVSLSYMKEKHL